MKRLISFSVIALLICMGIGVAENYVNPAGTCGEVFNYQGTDAFGDIISTIPSSNPGTNNAWVGMTYAGGFLYQAKNVASPQSVIIYKINPTTGAIVSQFTCPFTGYAMGLTTDGGTGFWVVQWYPTTANTIWHLSDTGAAISSFPAGTGAYSARTAMWDGTNLWVGANQSSNITNLYKMTTTGTILQTWSTNSVVGWYMGSEWNTQAPAGSEIFIVDNVGNTIKRLNVVGTSVTLNASVASPAGPIPTEYAEGLAFDGEYLWHCGAYASAGVVWKLDDGITGTVPNVTVTLLPVNPPIIIPPTGGPFDWDITLHNGEASPQVIDIWNIISGPATRPGWSFMNLTMSAGATINRIRTQYVSDRFPAGAYTYTSNIGDYPSTIWDSDSFPFTKTAIGADGWAIGQSTTATPAEYAVHGANPNPFNPTTTLNFALPQASQVKLSVYDVSGREVATLVNGWRDAGNHEVTFEATGLASGLYVYQLTAGDFHASGKMMLTK